MIDMKVRIVVTLQVQGLHKWPDAINFPEVAFLADLHRHVFHITCKKEVSHCDREIEIIMFKNKIIKYLNEKYTTEWRTVFDANTLEFGDISCEDIAKDLLDVFGLEYCSVLEDNENGAEIIKI